jgi:hypothetical protein
VAGGCIGKELEERHELLAKRSQAGPNEVWEPVTFSFDVANSQFTECDHRIKIFSLVAVSTN